MNRRDLMQCAVILFAGLKDSPYALGALSNEQRKVISARAPYIEKTAVNFFNYIQRQAITIASERIIPRTDTPGAIDAGVPRFIELMVSNWLMDGERKTFMLGLQDLLDQSDGDFSALSEARQLDLLEAFESEAADSNWYRFANTLRVWDEDAPFICQLKELTVLGFLLSEKGAREFLQINPMGIFDGSYPLQSDYSSYEKHTLVRLLSRETS